MGADQFIHKSIKQLFQFQMKGWSGIFSFDVNYCSSGFYVTLHESKLVNVTFISVLRAVVKGTLVDLYWFNFQNIEKEKGVASQQWTLLDTINTLKLF